jgi:hypothetical protein
MSLFSHEAFTKDELLDQINGIDKEKQSNEQRWKIKDANASCFNIFASKTAKTAGVKYIAINFSFELVMIPVSLLSNNRVEYRVRMT